MIIDSDILNNKDVKQVTSMYKANYEVINTLMRMNNSFDADLFESLDLSMWNVQKQPTVIEVPVLHRAFPTKEQRKVFIAVFDGV